MIIEGSVLKWLLDGDPAIRWQVMHDLLDTKRPDFEKERLKISKEGWGARLIAMQEPSGLWGGGIYTPKWISTTYTLLLLRRYGLEQQYPKVQKSCKILLEKGFYKDGGINYFGSLKNSETCVTGMVLSILSYFQYVDNRLNSLVDYLLREQMPDGGWNCQRYKGARHSSFHTTISVLEGLLEFQNYSEYAHQQIWESKRKAVEFLLQHALFKSHRTGEVVDPKMLRFSFPPRWRYDILRALDYFQTTNISYDSRMADALQIVKKKRQKNGSWLLQNRHAGKTFFEMEQVSKPSRWNTLRALRVLKWSQPNQ